MRTLLTTLGIGLAAAVLSAPPAAGDGPSDWTNLLAKDLRGWAHTGDGKNPWHLTADRTLASGKANDAIIPDREFGDGTLRFEYRFVPTDKADGYKGAVWARRTLHGTGCKVALGDRCGTLTATFQGGSDRLKSFDVKPAENPGRPAGSWNQVKVLLKGREVKVLINGHAAATCNRCDTDRGLVAFETEGSEMEFRNLMWKEAK